MQSDRAESIGVSALLFLAGDMQRLSRFLTMTGVGPAELRAESRSPHMLAAVLDHMLQDESMLLVFNPAETCKPPADGALPVPSHGASGPGHVAFALSQRRDEVDSSSVHRDAFLPRVHAGGPHQGLREPEECGVARLLDRCRSLRRAPAPITPLLAEHGAEDTCDRNQHRTCCGDQRHLSSHIGHPLIVEQEQDMATPAWVRRHRTDQHHAITVALTELELQARDRVDVEIEADEHWTPQRGMSFASDPRG